jgi:hypothetical protein
VDTRSIEVERVSDWQCRADDLTRATKLVQQKREHWFSGTGAQYDQQFFLDVSKQTRDARTHGSRDCAWHNKYKEQSL